TQGEFEPDREEATSGSSATDDPNATVPQLSFVSRADGAGAPAGFPGGWGMAESLRYRLLGPLGEGGMGVVYRAEDTRLRRIVAIKTVPATLAANQRSKQRFLDEARAASALDHPNVCTVYEIEETATGQLYLTMPCYDGETLKDRLKGGRLPVPEAVRLVRQVARGLAKAHQLGIVHCDIKPANLMLTADGIVKILDFGIARLAGQASAVPGGPSGSRGYRSPEQARGDEVEAASDIWSLGIVLLEMVAGRPPRRDEPEELLPLPEGVPPELAGVLSRMLAVSPASRYPHATALLADLDRLVGESGGRTGRRLGIHRRRTLWAAGLALGVGLAFLSWGALRGGAGPRGAAPSLPHAVTPTLSQVTDFPGRTTYPSLSPDGRTVVYARAVAGRIHLFSQPPVLGAEALDLTADSPDDDTQPSVSPDGRRIAFRSERDGGGIFLMPAQGGPARRLTDFGYNPAWSPDGREIACGTASIASPQVRRTSSEVFRVDVATGARRLITRGDAAQPTWSPHGKRIAYWGLVAQTGRRTVWTVPATGGEAVAAVEDDHLNWNPVWSPDGRYLYFVSDRSGIMNLWRVPIDEDSGRVTGELEPITASQQACTLPSLSRDGQRIAYASDGSTARLERRAFDPARGPVSGPATAVVQTSGVINDCSASPDGNWLVCQLLTPREELFLVHPDGSGWRRLLGDGHRNRRPQFSPDSSRIAFYSNRGGKYEIWSISLDGRRIVQETSCPGKFVSTPLWSSDGKTLACEVGGREALVDLTRPLSERTPQFLPPPDREADFIAYSWSPDGRWLAGARQHQDGSHDPGLLLYSLAEKKYVRVATLGDNPLWLQDSRRLLYNVYDELRLLDTQSRSSLPLLTFPADLTLQSFSLSPDDRGLYLARTLDEGHIWLMQLR
ncbi:MAG TPA: protein kinase, partial [Thermoanaerobaculia bacterium]|nr:protein kinase [Thermoanaerobaculia bacterium]